MDDYAWLKDDNWQQVLRNPALLDADIRSYLEAENRYTETILGPVQALQKTLVAEMRGRIKEDDSGVPEPDGPFAYLWKYRQGGQHELIGRTPRDGGDARIILDGDALAKATEYFNFGETQHSPDHRLEAWSADLRGSEYFTIRVRSWQSGEDLADIVEQTSGNVVWGRDSTFFLYVRLDENHRPLQVYRHRLGTAQSDDVLVYEEKDNGWFTRIEESASGRFCHRRHRQPGDLRALADRPVARRRHAAPGGGARDRRALHRLSIAATSSSSSPTRATRSISASPPRRWRRRSAATGAS